MKIAINKAHFPVTVLGYGRRIGLWLQGCSIRCPDCVAKDTWEMDPGREMPVSQLISWCKTTSGNVLDGITISGGEPFDQPEALLALLTGIDQWRKKSSLELDILCYSGYPLATLQKKHAHLLNKLDALIPEPYVDRLPLTHLWRGSENQPLVILSPLGEARYRAYQHMPVTEQNKQIQFQTDGNRLWCIGIPARGDMNRMEQQAHLRGLDFSSVSWR